MTTFGRILVLSAAALALTACGKKEEAPVAVASDAAAATDAAAAPAIAPTPGVYELSDAAGKKVATTTINADGSYAQDLANGQRVAGIIKMVDGKTCLDPSGKAEAACFTDSTRAADGSFTATDATGGVTTVRPKAK